MKNSLYQKGFTLIELLIVIALLGVVTKMMAPVFTGAIASQDKSFKAQQEFYNQELGKSLVEIASLSTDLSLPSPKSTSTNNIIDYSTLNADEQHIVNKTGIPLNQVDNDGSGGQNKRVYRKLTDVEADTKLFLSSGPAVKLTYDYGVLYSTESGFVDGLSDTAELTLANMDTWRPDGTDYGASRFSTLLLEKERLVETGERLKILKDKMAMFFRFEQNNATSAASIIEDNHYPDSGGSFVNLSTNATVLPVNLGLDQGEFGLTGWQNPILYCSNFDITTYSGTDVAFSALNCLNHDSGNPPYTGALFVPYNITDSTQNGLVNGTHRYVGIMF